MANRRILLASVFAFVTEVSSYSFTIDYNDNCFMKDGAPFRYISGGMHYFRIPHTQWNNRFMKARAMGLNAVQSYIAWNVHEPHVGMYDFEGQNNIFEFIELAQKNGLLVILRPGPYIDAEWEFGGFPWWMAVNMSTGMRTSKDPVYMQQVGRWYDLLLPLLRPYLYKNEGPVVAFQIENEYGNYYACDHEYMRKLEEIFVKHLGDDVVLFTTDGYIDDYLKCGTLNNSLTTIDFGVEISAVDAFKQLRKYQPNGPLVNSEFYTGWLDYWGRPHERRNSTTLARHLDNILLTGASINLYMFIGGTNFGFMNGMDLDDATFNISPTSYDYDAPLSEAGDLTEKYFALRAVIKKYAHLPLPPVPEPDRKISTGKIFMKHAFSLAMVIKYYPNVPISFSVPLTMEDIGQAYGFLLYEISTAQHNLKQSVQAVQNKLEIEDIRDRSVIYADFKREIVVSRGSVNISLIRAQSYQILVENQGRLAYAPKGVKYLPDRKGIIGDVKLNGAVVNGWTMYSINDSVISSILEQKNLMSSQRETSNMPGFIYYVTFTLDEVGDTFIKPVGWHKGQIYINKNNVGRYWQTMGPQKTLYVPKNFLKIGLNQLVLLEVDDPPCNDVQLLNCWVEFVKEPILG